ncbi:LCP family protein [Leifsonia shinshuensis]|uniref:LCP family protein required for cell wall assembly n=1 Tax=Leifsonia shinshuensis TaxID=150026 RepID=A0A853D1N2_9MICO|nr:LCP family protein [Leifsonia shinshuensis]NYJ25324.1 LCP family protein required for cell wall assembly [Leifsonia shinshuensis]
MTHPEHDTDTDTAPVTARRARRDRERERTSRTRRRRRWIWITAAALVLVLPVALIGGYLWWLGSTYDGSVGRIPNAFPSEGPRPTGVAGVTNILLIGSDSRDGLHDVMSGKATGERSDTLMLVHLPADRSGVVFVSIMRDLWVPIPGHGTAKINAAFSWGGVPLAVQTVEDLLGARIDHVMVVDFDGFGALSTALGGVEVRSDYAFTSKNMPGYSFVKGDNLLEGSAAVAFVRERYSFPDGDYQRVRNQQAFIRGILQSFISASTLTDPGRTRAAIGTFARYVAVDDGLDASAVASLALGYPGLRPGDIHTLTLPTAGTGTSPDGQSIVKVDPARTEVLRKALAADDVIPTLEGGALGDGRK